MQKTYRPSILVVTRQIHEARKRFMVNVQAPTIAFISSSINTFIYIFPHNLCKMQVFNLVFDSQILS